ncbi:MAG: hypothetical protein A2Z77_07500 [Chloroflexi bacterium RBG_13_51_36]|nr:MAG: hypothetical protein A2Z77_07500 [Chloroflexi bacterium RBG_13_51_36]
MKKTWQEKWKDRTSFPEVLRLEKGFPCYKAVQKMGAEVGDGVVLVNPSEAVTIMERATRGKLITTAEVSRQIAKNHDAKAYCFLTAGVIFGSSVCSEAV